MDTKTDIKITPFLVVSNAAEAVDFYINAFGAIEQARYGFAPDKVMSQIGIGNAEFWIGDEEAEFENYSPTTIGGSPVRIVLTIQDPEIIFEKALKAGASQICPVTVEAFWKIGKLKDPYGHVWEIGHPLEK